MSISGNETKTLVAPASPSQKKWYEDEPVVVDKDEERQTQFSRAGVGFDAIQVKMQNLYEVGVLKLFIESEILKSNSGAFEPGFKELYKDLLFTSDVEFSDSGFVSGSLENDKKKIFLNRSEFTNYLLRLPKPISDTTTPLDEKQDMNAYKYLQVLGTELQDKILFLCDNFIKDYNEQYRQNTNDISRLQKEINDLKRLTGPGITASDIQERVAEKEKELVQAKNVKIQLETKRANYKNACTLLSNSTRRSQYNASLVAAYPALKNDASSYSTVMLDWFKFKHNGSNFFKKVCGMYKLTVPNNMLTTRQNILISLQEIATKLGNIFKPIFESYFLNELTTNVVRYMGVIPNNEYSSYLFELSNPVTRRSDPSKFSWLNINAMFLKIIKETQFANNFDKIELERLQSVSQLMANFSSEILTFFSLFKFEKSMNIFNSKPNDNKNVYERAEQDDDFFKRAENINMLFQNVYYLKNILEMISNELQRVAGLPGLTAQQTTLLTQLQSQLNDIVQMINVLFPTLNVYKINVQRYDYETLLGEASHSGFVESIFSGKIAFISHFHKNNKFLVSSEYIQNSPVTITIPDGNYTLETLSSIIENALCNTCKWSRQINYDSEMLWRCKYDNKNFLQLGLYFPSNNMNNYPNILWGYSFIISSTSNTGARQYTLYIPKGEYKNIRQVLDAMQSTINDFVGKTNDYVRQFQSIFTITLEVNPATNTECVKFALQKKTPSDPNEDLTIVLTAPHLAQLLSKDNTPRFVPFDINVYLNNNINDQTRIQVNNIFANSEKILTNPPSKLQLSKTITIDTATMIDGERYDASDLFGIRRQANQANESLQLYPDIVTNKLSISSDYDQGSRICHNRGVTFQSCIFLSIIFNSQLELVAPNNVDNNNLNDFGRLDFTSRRINDELTFIPVNLKDIEKNANASVAVEVQNGFKSEILEKTGIYMSNRLLNPKVPVITPVDILNSILYRYPCIPTSHVKRFLKEGSTEFDEFIEQRVNIPEFNAIVCLGKGEKGQLPSQTFKNILNKTLMYDESDGRRNKLFCDLHYALCGPVYADVNPSREINQLTILDEFSLENNRPNVSMPGIAPPINTYRPFSVKGITPFYDYEKEYYKYLIYGEYTTQLDSGVKFTLGCVKYYDPGEKIGPGHNLNASELYDVIVTRNDNRVSSTIHKMIWLPSYQEHTVDRFIIIGEFEIIDYLDKYKTVIDTQDYSADGIQKYRIWSFAHEYPTPHPPPSYFSVNQEIDIITNYRGLGLDYRIKDVLLFDAFDYIFNVVITVNNGGETFIFIPYTDIRGVVSANPVPNDRDSTGREVNYKLSCSAISMNKSLQNICKSRRFYRIMENKYPNVANPVVNAYARSKVANSQTEYNRLQGRNPDSVNHLLWLGLKEKTTARKILSCKRIDRARLSTFDLDLPIAFEDGDSIENIRVDINNPEIVTVFGKFKATISDRGPSERPQKVIRNVMVIYTNLRNAEQNDLTYGRVGYTLEYDNFKGISINENEEFASFYSCVDGLIPASIDKGTMQQNIGILTVKKTQTSEPIVIGFHNAALSTMSDKSTVKEGAIQVPFTLCYDYNMCADSLKIEYDEFARPPVPPETKIEKGVFNPVTFYTSYRENVASPSSSFFKGVYALVHAKNPLQLFSSPLNLHALNTWGIDLSSNETLFYKRLYEASRTSATVFQFNIKAYEKYMNNIVETILGSAKAYYEDKIKSTFFTYGTIDGKPPIVFKRDSKTNRNIIVGGGKEEDAKQMLIATEYIANEDAQKSDLKNRKNVIRKKIVEIRIPDIMLSDYYVGVLTEPNRKNVRMIFVNAVFNYAKQLVDITIKQNEEVTKNKGADNNVIIIDEYHIVLCSKNDTIRNRFNELKALDAYASTDYLTLSGDVFEFELPSSLRQGDKQIIVVNEWNDKGFIGDYGAYAYSDASAATVSLTPNQMMVSKSRQIVTEATSIKEAVTKGVPKYPNTAFLLNPVFSYHTLDPSKWTGVESFTTKSGQVGGAPPLYPRSSYGFPNPYVIQGQRQAPFGAYPNPYGTQQGYGYSQPYGVRDYSGYGLGLIDNGDEVIRMKRKVLESSDIPSKNLKKINFQNMQTDTRFKKIVLWLFDSRENKMLMVKTLIGKKVILSLPVQNQQVGTVRASGYSLLQQLCRRLFSQADIIQKWTLEVSYAYNNDANSETIGIFIYSAKSYDLPKPTLELIYVNMQAVLNLTKGSMIIKKGSQQQMNESQLEINSRDIALVGEVFRVVPLIQGGIISSTSKEFNEIVANLVSKTPHQHLRSSISEKKRRENVEKNVQFLINLFFSQNSIFFLRGQLKYYIYSSQRSCKIFTIVKQPGYDDDSYLTCLKLFLQSEYDYKQKLSTFRVGCSMKKKLIADNFSSVWDNFWNDLIESQEQAKSAKQIESEIGNTETGEGEEGEGEAAEPKEQVKEVSKDDRVTAPVCLNGALTTCKKMYDVQEDWNASSYYPLAYDGISYTLDPSENPYGFNNEYYYNFDNLELNEARDTFYGFKCMKYNGDAKNPILYLGGKIYDAATTRVKSAVYEMSLLTKKIKPILIANNVDSEILCIDMVGNKHIIISGKRFDRVRKYVDGHLDDTETETSIPLVIMNLETYNVTVLYDNNPRVAVPRNVDTDNTSINKVCICKNRRVIDETQKMSYYEYVGLFGGDIQIETAGAGADPNIVNIGCVVIGVPIDDSNPNFQLFARMYCIDSKVQQNGIVIPGLTLTSLSRGQTVSVTSIVCSEEEEVEKGKEDGDASASANKTTFYVGGYFNSFSYMDYVELQEAEAAAAAVPGGRRVDENLFIKRGLCNSILKLTIATNYNTVERDYQQRCVFEPIDTNANKNNIIFNASLALYKKDSSSQQFLLAFTAFVDQTTNPAAADLNNSVLITTLNAFDLKTKLNTQVMIPVPNSRVAGGMMLPIVKRNYNYQCIAVVQDVSSKKYVAVMSYTINEYAYSFSCELNMEAPLKVIESKCNDEAVTSHNNSVTDICGIENRNGNQIDIYVAHENIIIEMDRPEDQILYPLTVKSNYQQIGNWNLGFINGESESDSETEIFFRFVNSIMELSKIFKQYPSSMLFLQNIDYREKNQKITTSVLEKMYFDLEAKTTLDDAANAIIQPKVINIQYSCNDIFLMLTFMLRVWNVATRTIHFYNSENVNLFNQIKNFYDYLIFLLLYSGCINLAQNLCDNYVNLVLSDANNGEGELTRENWKEKFLNTFNTFDTNSTFKTFFNEKIAFIDQLVLNQHITICSNPETYTGVAYMKRRIDKNLEMSTSETKQKALQNKIYKSNEAFFDASSDFFTTNLASDSINTIDQINFCSFYKFQRLREDRTPFVTNFGGMIGTTIYAAVNIDSNKQLESSKVLEFLKVIIAYFKRLPSGAPVVDIGIGGPIQRIIFGGNFGCNLLNDAQVCSQFAKNGMKVYTRPNNSNAFTDVTNSSGNQMFVVDVNLMSVSSLSGGGRRNGEESESNDSYDFINSRSSNGNNILKRRVTIGEPIKSNNGVKEQQNIKLVVVDHKKKTRRRYK